MTLSLPPASRLYGRRKGRPLRSRKTGLVAQKLPALRIALPVSEQGGLDPFALFSPRPRAVWLEIGFGGGEHLATQAKKHTDIGFIGCEPFLNGVAGLLDHIDRDGLTNVRILADDARPLLDALQEAAIDRCFVLFPDPWPKARHAARRFVGQENCARLARILSRGAELRLASDDPGLIGWIRERMQEAPEFEKLWDLPVPPEDWVETRYEQKAYKAGRQPAYMAYRRR
ncbi:MAG: tRNA (guanine(46)-N(7))-methyltransferase TrmB [Pseudomonadota bacterium]|nr:tRNA (guanine(46)-N(7))-methyltransferase TrmB [Pseudomonadota bacterium]